MISGPNFINAPRPGMAGITLVELKLNRGTFSESRPSQVGYTGGISALGSKHSTMKVLLDNNVKLGTI